MSYLLLALVQPGDEVIYPNPGFPIYESMIEFCGATAVPLPLVEERDFGFDAATLADLVTDKTRLVILNSPGNPTAGVLDGELLGELAKICVDRDLTVLSDEIYSRILYDGAKFESITAFDGMPERTCILDGFSKTYAMTGWRLGYGVMPVPLAERLTQIAINFNSCTSSFTQIAGIEALTGDQSAVEAMVEKFDGRRRIMVEGLEKVPGIRCRLPRGAFYAFPNIEGTGMTSRDFADGLLAESGVAVLPGTAFGAHGEGYVRLSFANSIDNIKAALERIDAFVRARLT